MIQRRRIYASNLTTSCRRNSPPRKMISNRRRITSKSSATKTRSTKTARFRRRRKGIARRKYLDEMRIGASRAIPLPRSIGVCFAGAMTRFCTVSFLLLLASVAFAQPTSVPVGETMSTDVLLQIDQRELGDLYQRVTPQ